MTLDAARALPPDLRLRYGAVVLASAAIRAGVITQAVPVEVQEDSRGTFGSYYRALEDLAAGYAVQDADRQRRFDEQEEQWAAAHPRPPYCPNCHRQMPEPMDLRPPRPLVSGVPARVSAAMPSAVARAEDAQTVEQWRGALADLVQEVDWMDDLLTGLLSGPDSAEAAGLAYLKEQRLRLATFARRHPSPCRTPPCSTPRTGGWTPRISRPPT